jgi:tRNA (cmo5U34)-methyltransferase
MAVASHLNIDLAEYDQKIRTFIPHYEEMLDTVASGLLLLDRADSPVGPTILEFGIGTGALASRALLRRPGARLIGIDADPEILKAAAARLQPLGARVDLIHGGFGTVALPRCHAAIQSFALHHMPDRRRKLALYRRLFDALMPGGMLISADCHPGANPRLAAVHDEAWREHLRQFYSRDEADAYLKAWASEDVYFSLDDEIEVLGAAGFHTDVLWRRDGFAVLAAIRPARRTRGGNGSVRRARRPGR